MASTIDIYATCPTYTLAEIKAREPDFNQWEMRNDKIDEVVIHQDDHGYLSLGLEFVSGKQAVGYGYSNAANIGLMLLGLADLLHVGHDGDLLQAFALEPIRVLSKFKLGGDIAELTYIGHYMSDRWLNYHDLIMTGIKEDGDAN